MALYEEHNRQEEQLNKLIKDLEQLKKEASKVDIDEGAEFQFGDIIAVIDNQINQIQKSIEKAGERFGELQEQTLQFRLYNPDFNDSELANNEYHSFNKSKKEYEEYINAIKEIISESTVQYKQQQIVMQQKAEQEMLRAQQEVEKKEQDKLKRDSMRKEFTQGFKNEQKEEQEKERRDNIRKEFSSEFSKEYNNRKLDEEVQDIIRKNTVRPNIGLKSVYDSDEYKNSMSDMKSFYTNQDIEALQAEKDKKFNSDRQERIDRGLAGRIIDSNYYDGTFRKIPRNQDTVYKKISGMDNKQKEALNEKVQEKECADQLAKTTKQMGIFNKLLSGNSGSLLGVLKGIGPEAAIAVGGLTLMMEAMRKVAIATIDGTKVLGDINSSLRILGDSGVNQSMIDANLELDKFNSNIDKLGTNLKVFLAEVAQYGGVFDTLGNINTDIGKEVNEKNEGNIPTESSSWRAMIKKATEDYNQNSTDALTELTNIYQELTKLGYSSTFSKDMSTSYYNFAVKIANDLGNTSAENIKKIANDLMSGNGAQYGYNNDDQTLNGWLYQEKGINAYAVKMTDAMKEYYRLQMMSSFYENGSTNAVTQKVKEYKELNALIENSNNGLYTFEKIIQSSAVDNRIPEGFDTGLIPDDEVQKAADQEKTVENYLYRIAKYRKELKQAFDDGIIDETTYNLMSDKLDRLELEVKHATPETLAQMEDNFDLMDDQFKTIGDSDVDPDTRYRVAGDLQQTLTDSLKEICNLGDINGRLNVEAYIDELNARDWEQNIDKWLKNEEHKLNVDVNYTGKGNNTDFDGVESEGTTWKKDNKTNKKEETSDESESIWLRLYNNRADVKARKKARENGAGILGQAFSGMVGGATGADGWTSPTANFMKFGLIGGLVSRYNQNKQIMQGATNSTQTNPVMKAADGISGLFTGQTLQQNISSIDSNIKNTVENLLGIKTDTKELSTKAVTNYSVSKETELKNNKEATKEALKEQMKERTASSNSNTNTNNNVTIHNTFNNSISKEVDSNKLIRLVQSTINSSIRTNNGKVSTSGLNRGSSLLSNIRRF